MELKIKASVNTAEEMENLIVKIRQIEKEHNCNCTLLDVTILH